MRRQLSACVGLVLLLSTSAWAQLASQTALVGTVKDSGGSVIPGAHVVAVNAGTKDTYEATTNAEGYYNIQFAKPGRYEITVTVSGFAPFKATGVEVATNQVVRTNATLQVGGITDAVTVEAKAQVLDTDRPTVSATINERAVVELPLNGRNVWNLAATTPGVLGGLNSDIGLSFRGAGQREIQNSLSLDGINSTANLLAATSMRPIADAVTEIQVQTGSTSAEYGSYLGVHVNVVTKSGTNQLHGSLFHFQQDDALDARGYFDNPALPKNPRTSKQFGAELDGPLMIPGLYNGKNRTFFMVAYEGVRGDAITSPIASVPTALMRQGNFSELTTPVRDPRTGQPFPGNIIPSSRLSPVALKLLQYYPEANRAGTANNFQGPSTFSDNVDQLLVRLDQNLGNKARLSLRYNWHDSFSSNVFNAAIPATAVTQPRTNNNWLFGYTHTLSNTLHNDFRIGYHHIDFDTLNPFSVNGQADAGTSLGIPGFDGDTKFGNPGIPSVNVSNFSGIGAGGTNWFQFDTTFQVSNVLAWTHGSHAIRGGFDLRRLSTGRRAANDARGLFNFTGDITGYSVADFMLGLPRTVIPPTDQLQGHVGGWRNGIFINDVWQATRNLTLNLGLRYELNTPVQTYEGFASMLDSDFETIIPSATLSGYPVTGFEFTKGNYKDIAPRLGATYRLGEKTVLRSGFGIYYNPNQMNTYTFLTNNPPLAPVTTYTSDPANPTLSFTTPSGALGAVPRPDIISPTRELPNARKTQWSFDVQRELFGGTAVTLQYVGSDTVHLDRSFFNNTPTPGPGAVDPRRPSQKFRSRRIITNDLRADYDAVSIILRKRMSHGLQADLHYTWSRTRDMATHSNGGGQVMNNYDIWADYGAANWDVPHRFVASYIYEPPFFKQSSNGFLKYVLGGWQIAGVTTLQSGTPANVTFGADRANIGITGLQRPDLVGAVPDLNCQPNTAGATPAARRQLINCYDPSAFALPAQFTFGSAPRNVLRGPNFKQTDVTLMKDIPLGKDIRFQVRAEVYNLFNRANFNNPNTSFGSAAFGSVTSLATGATMRRIQLGGKLIF
jgi:carboxypeptidase family protein/TonB-dependent receptor-like protein